MIGASGTNPWMGYDEYRRLLESIAPGEFRRLHSNQWVPGEEKHMDNKGFEEIDTVLFEMAKGIDGICRDYLQGEGPLVTLFAEMREVMRAKGHDYSGTYHTFKNFEWSSELLGNPVEMAFLQLMATKFSRLVGLGTQPEPPRNEPVVDTWMDLANYIVLMLAYGRFKDGQGQ